ncbi:hypothetical protein AYO41_00465 [Verrucomicrobia bacterium SCGC AG-212-E04]|nr:hypothetical protein AYO41_00465 [Verrucomicrobia bacterium SCGC AG-212-E04]
MRLFVVLLLVAVAALRLSMIGRQELVSDEAYYQMWSERLDWGYYSKGPGVAAAIRAGTALFGVNEFGVRVWSPLLGLGTALLLAALARRLYGDAAAVWTAVLVSVIPIFNVGGVLMTIDPLSVFFWVAAMWFVWLALERSPRGTAYWVLAGFAISLGFLCKYTNALQLVCVTFALAWVPRWRGELRRGGYWTMWAVACLGALPPIIWNANHAWITATHLLERGGFGGGGFRWYSFPEFLGLQALVYSPLIFIGLMIALVFGWKEATGHKPGRAERARFLLAFTLPILGFYAILALRKPGEPNWTALAYPSLCVLAAMLWHERAGARRRTAVFALAALSLGLAMSLVILDTDSVRQLGIVWPYKRDTTIRIRGWQATADAVATVRKQVEKEIGQKVFLIADKYQLAAELNFYLADKRIEQPGHPPVYLPESQEIQNQFSFWGRYDEFTEPDTTTPAKAGAGPTPPANEMPEALGENRFAGRSALFITDSPNLAAPPSTLEQGFEEWKCVARYEVKRRGLPVRTLTFFLLSRYQGMSL